MNQRTAARLGVVGVAALLIVAQPVRAQEVKRVPRPYRALFGGDSSNSIYRHQLSMVVSLNAGVDNGPAASSGLQDPSSRTSSSGLYSAGTRLSYAFGGRRLAAGAAAAVNLPYYSVLPDIREWAYDAGANASYSSLSGKTFAGARASVSHSPFFSPTFESGSSPTLSADSAGFAYSPNNMRLAAAWLTRRFGRLTGVTARYDYFGLVFTDEDRETRSGTVRLSADRQLSRSFAVTGGYRYASWDNRQDGNSDPSTSNDVDVGVRYMRPSPRGRSFTLDTSVGATIVEYRATRSKGWRGSVGLRQVLGANWSALASYSRSSRLDTAVLEPVWANDLRAVIGGPFGRRVRFGASAIYTWRERATPGSAGFDSYSLSADLGVDVSAAAEVTVSYLYSRYQFPAGYTLPTGVSSRLDRQRLQIGARFWLPFARVGRG